MEIRNSILSKHSVFLSYFKSFIFYNLFKIKYFYNKIFAGRHFVFQKGSSVSIHYKTDIQLRNSKIVLHEGASLKVGFHYGYFDHGGFSPSVDICRIHLKNSTFHVYGSVNLYPGSMILGLNGNIIIRNNTTINGFTKIMCKSLIDIGENCVIAQGTIIRDDDGHKHGTIGEPMTNEPKPVRIGNHCWLGQNVMFLKGSSIGDGTIVASGAVVSKAFGSNKIIAGIPAKEISSNHQWDV